MHREALSAKHAPQRAQDVRLVVEQQQLARRLLGRRRFAKDAPRLQQRRGVARRQRSGKQMALRQVATQSAEELQLARGLDAFDDDAQLQRARQLAGHAADHRVRRVGDRTEHKTQVDLQAVERQPREEPQVRVAGAEVVDRH